MSVTSVDKDYDNLTVTLVADFDASIEQVWQLWADPRKLERWWGPPAYPATFEKHDLSSGGDVTYYMTGPEGQQHHGWWRVTSVNPPKSLDFTDGFADQDGTPNADMPVTTCRMELFAHDGGTRMQLRSVYASRAELQQVVDMQGLEGIRLAVGQMDDLLAA